MYNSAQHFSSWGPCLRQEVIKRGYPLLVRFSLQLHHFQVSSLSHPNTPTSSRTRRMPLAWASETAGILASASLLIALAILLLIYDDKAVFEWKGVTLNAVVSVLSTASKAALLYSTSELISQWKWIGFTGTRRPLIDFQRIDAASRGPLGSLEIIWRSRKM